MEQEQQEEREHIPQSLELGLDEKSTQHKEQAKQLKNEIKQMGRETSKPNLYHLNKPQRKRAKEHEDNLDSLLSRELQRNSRVSI